MSNMQLIVGLGNPGSNYQHTRHNAGAWFAQAIVKQHGIKLKEDKKFQGLLGQWRSNDGDCRIFMPTTYMNNSGQALQQLCRFYQIPVDTMLVAHDELDLPAGTVRLKQGGGDGGHNGLRSIQQHLGTKQFNRLRIGIAHPGQKHLVTDYVLKQPSAEDYQLIMSAIESSIALLPLLLKGEWQKAMHTLHTLE